MRPVSAPPVTITILTPVRDAVATVAETLASVAAQTRPADQHLVIDGGSTDGTLDVLAAQPGLDWTSAPDRGLAHALNRGLARATGDVVGTLNADDVYLPHTLALVAAAFEREPDRLWLTGRCPIVDAHGREIRRPISAYKHALLRRYTLGRYLTHNFLSAPATFFRRDALEAIGGFDERYRISVDYDAQLRIARRGDPIVLDEELARFRAVPGTLSASGYPRQFREHAEQARRHGAGHPAAVAANQVLSAAIVGGYAAMGVARRIAAR